MTSELTATLARDGRKKAAVVSHERSGTHFLMNTLALNLGYVAEPWWNFDFTLGLNFHAPDGLRRYFGQVRGKPVLNVLKSHHHVGFFRPLLDELTEEFNVFYVCRDPRDVMVSFWRLVEGLPWDEGPRASGPADFMRAPPSGALLRYQKSQAPTMLHRWVDHVNGWLDAAEALGPERLMVVTYESLSADFEGVTRALGPWSGVAVPAHPERPRTNQNVIGSGAGRVGGWREHLSDDDDAWVREVAGRVMARCGWLDQPAPSAV